MVARRVVDDHKELSNIGELNHEQLDNAVSGSSFLVVSGTDNLSSARSISAGTGIVSSDGGVGSNFSLNVDDSVVATISGSHFDGSITTTGTGSFETGITGSLTNLTDGTSYLISSGTTIITTQSNGSIEMRSFSSFGEKLFHVRDEKPDGTAGGDTSAGVWNIRDLNTILTNEIGTGVSVSNQQVTLPAGKYWIDALAPVWKSDTHRLRWREVSGSTLLVGGTNYTFSTENSQTNATLRGRFTITGSTVFNLEHYTESARATFGLGSNVVGDDEVEVYSDVNIWKLD